MKVIDLYQAYDIPFVTGDHKHSRPGWVNIECPFCTGNPGYHLGATLNGSIFKCWRCGWKPATRVISKVLNMSESEARILIRDYGGISKVQNIDTNVKIRKKAYKLPSDTTALGNKHKQYLLQRGFDPDYIIKKWKVLATGPHSFLGHINYSRRILIPFFWDGQEVTYQGRDITGKHPLKYMACPKDREIIEHKHILYGNQTAWRDVGICVEGVTDVWRLGDASFATCGIEFTDRQVRLIAKRFKKVFVLFDDEVQAIAQADEMVSELLFRGVAAERITIKGDPGAMSQDDADALVRFLI